MVHEAQAVTDLSPEEQRALLAQLLEQEIGQPDYFPLSFAQQRLWFLDRLEPNSSLYNIPVSRRLVGTLDPSALEKSLNKIIQRHEALRTTFVEIEGEPFQVVAPTLALTLPVKDLSQLKPDQRQAKAGYLMVKEARRPFDLSQGPLLRATLLRLSEQEHILLVTMHHIVSDGWSTDLLFQELATFYAALVLGTPSTLDELPIQYVDYTAWQREWLQGEVLESQLTYWKEQLAGAPKALELPTDYPRPFVQSYKGATCPFELPSSLAGKLRALGEGEESTLFITLLAAFKVLLHRYTGQSDLVVGSPIANRSQAETHSLIGFFVNTQALRTDLSGNPTFRQLLNRVRQVVLDAYAHQDLPFERLVEEIQPERVLSHSPLFQVMFSLHEATPERLELPGLAWIPLETHTGTAKFDLTLLLENTDQKLRGMFEYNTDLFKASTVERMAGHLQTLLHGIVADPDQPITDLPLLTSSERQQILVEWNATQTDYPRNLCVHQLFQAQANKTPNATAVSYRDQQLSYQQLNQRANQLAHHLERLGVGPGVIVGILMERSPEMIVGTLAILKAGGVYLPLDSAYPKERLAFMLQDAQAPVLLTQACMEKSLPKHNAHMVRLDMAWNNFALESTENPSNRTTSEHPAYLMYTSGSTGKPKGIIVPHKAINRLVFETNYIHLSSDDRVAQAANISFDAATFEIWGALLHGACLIGITKDVALSPQDLADQIREREINVLFLTTALFNQLARTTPGAFQSLSHLLFGGEAVTPRWVREILENGPPQRLLHVYGPTESTTYTSWHLVQKVPEKATTIPIGSPVSNTQIYLLDRRLQPVPVGVPGELYIGGDGLALHYLNRPALTAERFIPNPFSDQPGARLYKTGDLVRYLPDGNVEFLGRTDFQVKLRGFRIELGEIESTLAQHPDVREAAVLAREDTGDKRLVAYVVQQDKSALSSNNLRDFLRDKLPDYMLPSAFVGLEALPLTPNGKVDRRALPIPDQDRLELETAFVAPRTPSEELLANIWAQLLRVERVGVHDNFFELGGHSLLATQIVSRVRDSFQIELPLRALFEAPTVACLAERVDTTLRQQTGGSAPPIQPVAREGAFPLSFAQRRLWFLDQWAPGDSTYNIPLGLCLTGPLNVPALECSLNEIIRRHQSLRTSFDTLDGEPVQVIAPAFTLSLPLTDLRHLPPTEQETQVQQWIVEQTRWNFDLSRGPLFRASLLRLDELEHILFFNMHHIISDGWSLGVLVQELRTLYRAFCAGEPSPLPQLPIQYTDFAVWQRNWLQGDVLEAQLAYWEQQLGGEPVALELPTDRPRPPVQTHRGNALNLVLSESLSQKLKSLSQEQGCSLFMTLLAAFKVLLCRYSGQTDILVGSPIAGRNWSKVEDLIGIFLNTLVLRTDLAGDPHFSELLKRVRETTIGAYAHQDLPFEILLEALQPERDLSRTPLFQVFFNMINLPVRKSGLTGLKVTDLPLSEVSSKFDLTLYVNDQDSQIHIELVYNADLFTPERMDQMLEQFNHLLAQIVANPETTINNFSLVPPTTRERLPDPSRELDTSWHGGIHTLFTQQARQTPDQLALVDQQRTWTYGELNAQSNRLAHCLLEEGLQTQDIVAIYAHRSASLVWAILGVLKAGGAFVILDPAYPATRLIQILEQAQPRAWLQVKEAGELDSVLEEFVDGLACHRLVIQSNLFETHPSHDPEVALGPEDLACVGFTSGSTGVPKGILGKHGALSHFLPWQAKTFDLKRTDRYSMASGLAHDPLQRDIFTSLALGATLCIPNSDQVRDPGWLAGWMRRQRISVANLTPAMLQLLTQTDQVIPSLRRVFTIGEALTKRDVSRLRQTAPGVTCVNLYGPTETQRALSYWIVPDDEDQIHKEVIPLGKGMPGMQLLVLNSRGQLAGVGELGEIHIRSPHVAKGYLNDEKMTQERFITNPFTDKNGDWLYKTGDLGRYLPDGNVEFCGRADQQVKIRGFRVELGEVEAALSRHPKVRETVVAAHDPQHEGSGKLLVAYVVANGTQSPNVSDLRRFLHHQLPDYMTPSAFCFLDKLPLNPSGKVDRRALPRPEGTRPDLEAAFVAPRTPIEETLADIWAQVLQLERVGVHDNFFDLGGHSLLATRLASRLRKALELELPLRYFFESPTVAGLAENVEALRWAAQAPSPTERDGYQEGEL